MNKASREIVDQITANLVMPNIGLTITQEEADAIKEHVRARYFEENIQGAVHSGFVRHENNVN
jgi:large-conductance mechanosensitive channel